jgi:hypothetical protein
MTEKQDDLTLVYMFGYKNGKDSMKAENERLRAVLQEMAWKDEKKTGYEHMTPETVQAIRDTCSTPASRVGKTQSEVFKEEDTP